MNNCKTYSIDAIGQFLSDGGATVSGFIATGSQSGAILASVSGWQPNGGGHPTVLLTKRSNEGGRDGIWFRLNFVNDVANGKTWITFFQGGQPNWSNTVSSTATVFDGPPWN